MSQTETDASKNSTPSSSLAFNKQYAISVPGILKYIVVILLIIALASVDAASLCSKGSSKAAHGWFNFVGTTNILTVIAIFILFLVNLTAKLTFANWIIVALVHHLICAVCAFIAGSVEWSKSSLICREALDRPYYGTIVGSIFMLLAAVVHLLDGLWAFKVYRSGDSMTSRPV